MLAGQLEKAFPISVLGLFATGAYMTSDIWTWSTRWIVVSIVALAVVALQGPLVAGRRAKVLEGALRENGPGPLGEPAKRLTRDRALWIVTLGNPGIVFGIVWNMTQKPGWSAPSPRSSAATSLGLLWRCGARGLRRRDRAGLAASA